MTELVLPWPPSELSPNKRLHWRALAKHKAAYKGACWALAKQAGAAIDWDGDIHVWLDFYPPDKRHRDDDNMIASFKSGRDGVALAMGVNDRRFKTHPFVKAEIGGMIKMRFTPGP